MKTLSKVLSMLIVIVMCLSLFGASAYAMPIVYGADDEASNSWDQGIPVPQVSGSDEPGAFDEPYELPGSEDKPVIGDENEVPTEIEIEGGDKADEFGITPFTSGDAVWQGENGYYNTLQEAVNAASKNGKIILNGMATLGSECKINKSVTIDLAGQNLAIDNNGKITITGGTVTFTDSVGGGAIEHSGVLANVTGGTLVINGGTYGEPSFGGSGKVVIKNGSFDNKPADKYIDGNSSWDGTAVVAGAEKIASINGRGYDSVQAAVDAATKGQTIVINTSAVENIDAGDVTVNSKNLTFDVNDETVVFSSLNINNANVTIKGYEIEGTVTLENSTLNLNTQKAGTVDVNNSSTLNVNGGEVTAVSVINATVKMSSGRIASLTAKNNSTLNISGGKIDNFTVDNPGSANRAITGGTWVINDATALDYFKNSLAGNLKADESKAPTYTVTGSGSNPGGTTNPPTSGSYSVSTKTYTKGSDRAVYITAASNAAMPTAIWYGNSSKGDLVASLGIDYTSGRNTYIDNSDLDAMSTGTYYLFAEVNGTAYYAGPITIYSRGTGTDIPDYDGTLQVGTRYENDWYQGDEALQFYVSPFPGSGKDWTNMKIYIDGRVVGNLDYYDYHNGYFYIGTSKLSSLGSGTHWLTVENIKTGETGSCTFYVGPTLRARDTNKHVTGSSKDLKFICSEPISRVWVGDKELDNYDSYDYYTLSRDGKTVTLTARFLNNRTAGNTYTLTVETNTGERVSTTFQILTTAQASSSPKTGDNSNLALWISALVMSGAAAAVIVPSMKRKEIED